MRSDMVGQRSDYITSSDDYLVLSPLQTISRKRGLKFALSWTSRFTRKRFRIPAV